MFCFFVLIFFKVEKNIERIKTFSILLDVGKIKGQEMRKAS